MPKYLVRGETTFEWEARVEAADENEAQAIAKTSFEVDWTSSLEPPVTLVGHSDRVFRVREIL